MLPAPLTLSHVLLAVVTFAGLFIIGIAFTHPRRGNDWLLILTVAVFLTTPVSFFAHDLDDERHWMVAVLSLFGLGGLFWIIVAQNQEIRLYRINRWLRRRSGMRKKEESEQVS